MEFRGSELIRAGREAVFGYITDAENFSRGIPDIQRVTVLGPDRFEVVAKLGISMIRASFDMTFQVLERLAPSYVKLRGHGLGAGSAVDLEISIDLTQDGPNTALEWKADANVSGTLASLGQRVLGSVAERLVREVFGNLHASLEPREPA